MEVRKGQAFIAGAAIFSTLAVLVVLSSGPEIQSPRYRTQDFFSQSLEESSRVFNDALDRNYSIQKAKRRMYSYDRFLEFKSTEKGITYQSYSLLIIPDRGKAVFINYHDKELKPRLRIEGSWTNKTVKPEQNFETSFSSGKPEVVLEFGSRDARHNFTTSTATLLKHSEMESEREKWENTLLG